MTFQFNPGVFVGLPPHHLRQQIADHIERMIALLDAMDGDCDLEASIHDDDREPDLAGDQTGTALEEDNCDDEPDVDDEESLGWTISGHGPCTAHRYVSPLIAMCDREGDEHDGREPDIDDECDLGWTNRIDQECPDWHGSGKSWKNPSNTDLELGDDNGVGDMDGVREQFGGWLIKPPAGIVMWLPEGVL